MLRGEVEADETFIGGKSGICTKRTRREYYRDWL